MIPRLLALVTLLLLSGVLYAEPKLDPYWNVDDLKAGMKGTGLTVMKGTKVESFDAEILGVLKNTAPGRDMILARLSGLGLEKTGVIAGMSGSPITIDGKLVGAVAYAWQFGKEPIAGVTPFTQMKGFVEAFEERDRLEGKHARKLRLREPLTISGQTYTTVAVASSNAPTPTATDEMWMLPLQTPVATSGFSAHSLKLFREQSPNNGLLPVMGGATPAKILDEEKNVILQPGGPLCLAMVTGDFDMSGIGTVTHIEGDRVYGWGHPFLGLGACEFPMQTGYVHTIYPRQTVSFKMGSPLKTVGVVNADVSTCIAGTLGRKPDMIPVSLSVRREVGETRTFNVQMVRQRSLFQGLLFTVLTNALDMEGELPDELTADIELTVELEDRAPFVLRDTFAGSSITGGRAPTALYQPIAQLVASLHGNPYGALRIKSISCQTIIRSGRSTAEIEAVELDADTLAPGDTLKATVHLRPWKSSPISQRIELKLPAELPEGSYTVTITDDLTRTRLDLRDRPDINIPQSVDGFLKGMRTITEAKRTTLTARVPVKAGGVAIGEQPLPNLPPGMVQLLGQSKKSGSQLLGASISTRLPTEWVIVGSENVNFTVAKRAKLAP